MAGRRLAPLAFSGAEELELKLLLSRRKTAQAFVEQRLDGLHDEPRSGAPRTIEDARIEAVIVKTLESVPENATHWSSRGMAKASGSRYRLFTIRIISPASDYQRTEFFLVRPEDVIDPTILKISEMALQTSVFEGAATRFSRS